MRRIGSFDAIAAIIACAAVTACGHPGSTGADATTVNDAAPSSDADVIPGPNDVLVHVRTNPGVMYTLSNSGVTASTDMDFVLPAVPNMTVSVRFFDAYHVNDIQKNIGGVEAGDVLNFDLTQPATSAHPLSITLPSPPDGVTGYVIGARCTQPLGGSSVWVVNECAQALGPTTIYAAGHDALGHHIADLAVANVNLMQNDVALQGTWTQATGSLSVTLHAIDPEPGHLTVFQIPLDQNAPLIEISDDFAYASGHATDDTVTIHVAPSIGNGFAYGVEWHGSGDQVYRRGETSAPTSMSFDLGTVFLPKIAIDHRHTTTDPGAWHSAAGADGFVEHCFWFTPESNYMHVIDAVLPAGTSMGCGTAEAWSGSGSYRRLRQLGFGPLPTTPVVGEVLRTSK